MNRMYQRCIALFEVAIVIAITGVVAGVIYASAGESREKARQARCLSNLHQIGLAISLYRQDYGGIETPGSPERMGLPPSLLVLSQIRQGSTQPYLRSPEVLHCNDVSPDEFRRFHLEQGKPWCLYGYQIELGPAAVIGIPSFEAAVKRRGTRFPLVYDDHHDHPRPDRPPPPGRLILVLRMDGSAAAVRVPRVPSWRW